MTAGGSESGRPGREGLDSRPRAPGRPAVGGPLTGQPLTGQPQTGQPLAKEPQHAEPGHDGQASGPRAGAAPGGGEPKTGRPDHGERDHGEPESGEPKTGGPDHREPDHRSRAGEGLAIEGLTVDYGARRVLDGITLPPLRPGELTLLLGPNAAGKSTLLRALAGLHPARGQMLLDCVPLSRLGPGERAGRVGFMPQSLPSRAEMTVLDSVIAALRASGGGSGGGVGVGDAAERALAVLQRLGIARLALERLSRLSGGQRQLASLAQTLVRDPRLLLLDEPTSALDLARSHRMMAEMRALAGEGRIVLAVLHDLALAAQWADRLLVLQGGRLHSDGPPAQVLTEAMLAEVYGVEARIERCSRGRLLVLVDGVARSTESAAGSGAGSGAKSGAGTGAAGA